MHRHLRHHPPLWLVAAAAVSTPVDARAVDTVETWDVGATDVDFYFGFDGLGLDRQERGLSGDLMLGYGIVERFSVYLGATLAADELLDNGVGEVSLGTFGTPLDTDHVDLDLFMDFRLGGEGFSELQLTPALELNLDLAPDLERLGLFLAVGLPIYRQTLTDQDGQELAVTTAHVEATLGAYLTVAERHQLLVDYEMAFRPNPGDGERRVEVGSVGIGYNVTLHEAVELITEVRLDLPQGEDERVSAGLVAGLIATLPSSRRQPERQVEGAEHLALASGAP